jgi:hypothetical protein
MLKAITRAANSVSSFADFICFKKINKYLTKSLATRLCFLKALIKSNRLLEV